MLVCALAKAGIRRPVKFSGRRAMTSISWAFEIIEKFTDTIPYSCVTFGVIITLDPSRNGRGFGANLFTRQCHLSKTKLRTKVIHFARGLMRLRKTTIKVSDFIQNCSHPQFTLQMLGASSCPPSPGTEAIQ